MHRFFWLVSLGKSLQRYRFLDQKCIGSAEFSSSFFWVGLSPRNYRDPWTVVLGIDTRDLQSEAPLQIQTVGNILVNSHIRKKCLARLVSNRMQWGFIGSSRFHSSWKIEHSSFKLGNATSVFQILIECSQDLSDPLHFIQVKDWTPCFSLNSAYINDAHSVVFAHYQGARSSGASW